MNHLINITEDPPCGKDDEERVVNGFVTLILSYNQHFEGEIFYAEDVLHNYIELSVSLWPYYYCTRCVSSCFHKVNLCSRFSL